VSHDIFKQWTNQDRQNDNRKNLWRLTEIPTGREKILPKLAEISRDHYASDEEVADWIEELGYDIAATCLRENFPLQDKGRSADIGEIIASEIIEQELGYVVPVKKLRDKDHREQAMRGEDVIGVAYDNENLCLLKGESKSARSLAKSTVVGARVGLESNGGRPSSHSLIFIGRRLIRSSDPDEKQLGIDLMTEAALGAIPKSRIAHYLFTLSGNPATDAINEDYDAVDGAREQYIVNFRIEDHKAFVDAVFEEIVRFGDS
jgi:hypothetical protein